MPPLPSLFTAIARRAPGFRHPKFTIYWLGMLVSIAGSQMQVWALYWHISRLSPDPIAVSGIGAARFIPILLFSLIAGLTADRRNRRLILFLTQSTMALVALGLALLTFADSIQLWHIYLLTAIQATAQAFDAPARQSLVPNLVSDRADLPSAFSLQSIASNTGAIVGPALSGLVIANLGQGYTYLINAVSFLSVIAALVVMGPIPQQVIAAGQRVRGIDWKAIGEGIRFIFSQPIILSSMVLDFLATFFSSANTLLPFVATQILHVGEVEYGWLSAGQSLGAVVVGLVLASRHNLPRQGQLLLAAVIVFGLATVVFGLSPYFWLTLFALVFIGAADGLSTILRNTIRQIQTPDHIRGRMVSVNQIFFMGGPQLGEIEAGAVAQAFGIEAAIVTGGIGCILSAGLVARIWPQLPRYSGHEPAPTPA
jgi:MFS family permease